MCRCCVLTLLILLCSCREKKAFKEIRINKNILKEIKSDRKISKKPNVYIISLFSLKAENICEIVRYKESPKSTNFIGCQLFENDTIFLYTDKKNNYLNCYVLSGKTINVNKKQFAIEDRQKVGYYKMDTLNCKITKFVLK